MTIIFPKTWESIGTPITLKMIDETLQEVIEKIPCNNLSYSGGIDSSILLYYLLNSGRKVNTFTITCDEKHLDNKYSKIGIDYYTKKFGWNNLTSHSFVEPQNGNELVKTFYQILKGYCDSIITGDGIDEFMGGYYKHQQTPIEKCYLDILYKLQENHLLPLNENSGDISVYIPYLSKELILLYTQIPLVSKINCMRRKLVVYELAKGKVPESIMNRRKSGFGTK